MPTYGCNTLEDVENHYKNVGGMASIKTDGYKIQGFTNNKSPYPDDILVSIGSEGDIFLERNGTHRLTLANTLIFQKYQYL